MRSRKVGHPLLDLQSTTSSAFTNCASGFNICRGDTGTVNGFLPNSTCCQFQTKRLIPWCIFFLFFFSVIYLPCWLHLPFLQPGPDDGFVELGNLSLQHWPQVLPQPVVVLLQLLLVLFLVQCDQVLILLNCLATSITQTIILE